MDGRLGQESQRLRYDEPNAIHRRHRRLVFASYFISWLVQRAQIQTFNQGMGLAVLLWVGVALPLLAPHYLFAGIHASVLMIDAMNALVQLVVTCGLLAVWRKR